MSKIVLLIWLLLVPGICQAKEKTIKVVIPQGASAKQTAAILNDHHIISYPFLFSTYLKLKGMDTQLRAGSFGLNADMSYSELSWNLLRQSGIYDYIKVTIPEGFGVRQIAHTLQYHQLVSANVFMHYVRHEAKAEFKDKYPFLEQIPTTNLEGYLFPNTYYFDDFTTLKTIVDSMLKEFEKKAWTLYQSYILDPTTSKGPYTFHHMATLASMIEKEAQQTDEMPMISSVFYNRLKRGMPLASDPTIVYALGYVWKKTVLYRDLKVNSPYNTYKYKGLPPTPIGSFGVNALNAALKPDKSPYLFFVADNEGKHIFTKTYREHLAAQRRRN